MMNAINNMQWAVVMVAGRLAAKVSELDEKIMSMHKDEQGQTATEYVAMTAVGLVLAIVIVWLALKTALNTAVSTIGSKLTSFVTNAS